MAVHFIISFLPLITALLGFIAYLLWNRVFSRSGTVEAANTKGRIVEINAEREPSKRTSIKKRQPCCDHRQVMMIFVSVLVLCSSLYVILSDHYEQGSQKWAFGAVGSITGFWLRSAR